MNVKKPETWTNFDDHPRIIEPADVHWRENHAATAGAKPDAALELVRDATIRIRNAVPIDAVGEGEKGDREKKGTEGEKGDRSIY